MRSVTALGPSEIRLYMIFKLGWFQFCFCFCFVLFCFVLFCFYLFIYLFIYLFTYCHFQNHVFTITYFK